MKKEALFPPSPPPTISDYPTTTDATPNPDPSSTPSSNPIPSSSPLDAIDDCADLGDHEFLSREEVLRRRSRRTKRLESYYRDQYWALMEEVRAKHREYYWNYGISPIEEERGAGADRSSGYAALPAVIGEEGVGENGVAAMRRQCEFVGCRSFAMPLTRYCHPHILSDNKQVLYNPCSYVLKSGQTGPIVCGKPVLRAATPSLCSNHFQKAQKHLSQALKKAGLSTSSSSRPAPKLHVIIAEYLHQIQNKRREAPKDVDSLEGIDKELLSLLP